MKTANTFMELVTLLVTFPVSWYLSWLLYNHVGATELMWFLWWLILPLNLTFQIITRLAKSECA
jgi:hypothetical protein